MSKVFRSFFILMLFALAIPSSGNTVEQGRFEGIKSILQGEDKIFKAFRCSEVRYALKAEQRVREGTASTFKSKMFHQVKNIQKYLKIGYEEAANLYAFKRYYIDALDMGSVV